MRLSSTEEKKITALLSRYEEIELAYLFGSFASGLAGKESDVDIAILLSDNALAQANYRYRHRLATEIEEEIEKEVDLRIMNGAPIYALYQVIKNGRLLYAASPKKKASFEAFVISRYLDMKPYWDLYDRYREIRLTKR